MESGSSKEGSFQAEKTSSFSRSDSSKIKIWIIRGILLLLLIFVIVMYIIPFLYGEFKTGKWKTDLSNLGARLNLFWQKSNIFSGLKKTFDERIAFATGDLYTSEVERNQREPLGVYFDKVQPSEEYFFPETEVQVFGILSAKTITEPIEISLKCNGDEKGGSLLSSEMVEGKIDPDKPFTVSSYDKIDFSCVFPKNAFSVGSKIINIIATFNFQTSAYQKVYIMDKSKITALMRENTDPYEEYGLERETRAVCTNGPINLGFGITSSLISVDTQGTTILPMIGATVNNIWDGKIKEIKNVEIQVPEGFDLGCSELENIGEISDETTGVTYKTYRWKKSNVKMADDQEKIITLFKCRLTSNDINRLMEPNFPVTARYFRVKVDYVYEAKAPLVIEVRCPLGFVCEPGKTPVERSTESDIPLTYITPPLTYTISSEETKTQGKYMFKLSPTIESSTYNIEITPTIEGKTYNPVSLSQKSGTGASSDYPFTLYEITGFNKEDKSLTIKIQIQARTRKTLMLVKNAAETQIWTRLFAVWDEDGIKIFTKPSKEILCTISDVNFEDMETTEPFECGSHLTVKFKNYNLDSLSRPTVTATFEYEPPS